MKLRYLAALLLLPCLSFAEPVTVNRSSFTKTNQSAAYIPALHLDKIIVGSASANGTIIVWNSTSTTSALLTDAVVIASVTLGTAQHFDFNNVQVKGIVYQTNQNTSGVTILYKK